MISEIKLASGELRYRIEVRVDGNKRYGFAKSRTGAERLQDEFIAMRRKKAKEPTVTVMDTFLRMNLIVS